MHETTSTNVSARPRVRRGLGLLVGVAVIATPLAATRAASAEPEVRLTPELAQQFLEMLEQMGAGFSDTVENPVGESAPNAAAPGVGYADGLGSTGTTIVAPVADAVDPGPRSKARVKASLKRGKLKSVRWVK